MKEDILSEYQKNYYLPSVMGKQGGWIYNVCWSSTCLLFAFLIFNFQNTLLLNICFFWGTISMVIICKILNNNLYKNFGIPKKKFLPNERLLDKILTVRFKEYLNRENIVGDKLMKHSDFYGKYAQIGKEDIKVPVFVGVCGGLFVSKLMDWVILNSKTPRDRLGATELFITMFILAWFIPQAVKSIINDSIGQRYKILASLSKKLHEIYLLDEE
ncbi:MAG: hypothetical protein HQL25_06585 [Candidatus Omnitrophica bacterium]|nr:hypothetical protein [Candidatus Omnitrophota bacterium]